MPLTSQPITSQLRVPDPSSVFGFTWFKMPSEAPQVPVYAPPFHLQLWLLSSSGTVLVWPDRFPIISKPVSIPDCFYTLRIPQHISISDEIPVSQQQLCVLFHVYFRAVSRRSRYGRVHLVCCQVHTTGLHTHLMKRVLYHP